VIAIFVLGLKTQAQTGNLIFNGDFEQWDTSRYVTEFLNKDSVLCREYLTKNYLNEQRIITTLKNINYCRWVFKKDENQQFRIWPSFGHWPVSYKACYPQYLKNHFLTDEIPIKGETFIGLGYVFDTVTPFYNNQYRTVIYMKLKKPLVKGKIYQFDFDFKNFVGVYNSGPDYCSFDKIDYTQTKMFGFGFTVNQPNYIQDPVTFKTNFKPQLPLEPFQSSTWKNVTKYFVADSAYQYLVFGYFGDVKTNHIYSKTTKCYEIYPPYLPDYPRHLRYSSLEHGFLLDNFNLQPYPDQLLPNDTNVCLGNLVSIKSHSSKSLKWYLDGEAVQVVNETLLLKVDKNKYMIVVSDSIANDTVYVFGHNFPQINVIQTDTLCDDRTIQKVFPDTLFYSWLPDNLTANPIELKNNNPRTVIASNQWGCADTLTITPVLGNLVCGSFYIPNAFSPNENDKNEVFKISGSGIIHIELEIYDRWGEKVFNDSGTSPVWDGTYKNKNCPEGVYLYKFKITYKNKNHKNVEYHKGTVTLLR